MNLYLEKSSAEDSTIGAVAMDQIQQQEMAQAMAQAMSQVMTQQQQTMAQVLA